MGGLLWGTGLTEGRPFAYSQITGCDLPRVSREFFYPEEFATQSTAGMPSARPPVV
jgi:hypothetical protein